jgi:hypothetical protein
MENRKEVRMFLGLFKSRLNFASKFSVPRGASYYSSVPQRQVGWMTVPAFGEWDVKNGAVPDYSMDFSKIREMRKQNKRELSRASLGGDEDILQQQQKPQATQPSSKDDHRRQLHDGDDRSLAVNNNSRHSHSPLASVLPN